MLCGGAAISSLTLLFTSPGPNVHATEEQADVSKYRSITINTDTCTIKIGFILVIFNTCSILGTQEKSKSKYS